MSTNGNYASIVNNALAFLSVANPNRDGTGAVAPVLVAGPNGSRLDRLNISAISSTTAGMLRFFIVKGEVGALVTSMTAVGTTVTVTTAVPHGMANTDKLYMQDAFPAEYNASGVAVVVGSATTFTYTVAVAPTAVASTVGNYTTTIAVPSAALWREIPVSLVNPSATVSPWTASATSASNSDSLPLQLAPGNLLIASTEKAEVFAIFAPSGRY